MTMTAAAGVPVAFGDRIRCLHALTGNVVETHLLERILYWHPHAQHVDTGGGRWLIRTAEEFQRDGCPWHLKTIRAALRRLAKKGLIEIEHSWHRFRRDVWRPNCSYIRPVLKALSDLLDGPSGEGGKGSPALPRKGMQGGVSLCSTAEQSIVTGASADDVVLEGGKEDESPTAGEPTIMQKAGALMASLSDTVAALAGKPLPRADLSKPLTALGLHAEIRYHCKQAWPLEVPPEKNAMRLKWLKQALERFRAVSCTDEQIVEITGRVIGDWTGFVAFVKSRTGWQLKEVRPTHLTFVQQAAEMVNFAAQGSAGAAPEVEMSDDEKYEAWKASGGGQY